MIGEDQPPFPYSRGLWVALLYVSCKVTLNIPERPRHRPPTWDTALHTELAETRSSCLHYYYSLSLSVISYSISDCNSRWSVHLQSGLTQITCAINSSLWNYNTYSVSQSSLYTATPHSLAFEHTKSEAIPIQKESEMVPSREIQMPNLRNIWKKISITTF